jgi:hypothetical protein
LRIEQGVGRQHAAFAQLAANITKMLPDHRPGRVCRDRCVISHPQVSGSLTI